MHKKQMILVVGIALCVVSSSRPSFAKSGRSAIQTWATETFGGVYKDYYFWEAPSTTFTLGTVFEKTANEDKPLPSRTIYFPKPFDYFASGTLPSLKRKFANDVVITGNTVDLTMGSSTSESLNAAVGVAALLKVVGVDLSGEKTSEVNTSITAGQVQARSFNIQSFKSRIEKKRVKTSLLGYVKDKNYGIVMGDIVVKDLVVTIDASNSSSIATKIEAKLSSGTSLSPGIKIGHTGTRKYKLTTTTPLTLATLVRYPRSTNPDSPLMKLSQCVLDHPEYDPKHD